VSIRSRTTRRSALAAMASALVASGVIVRDEVDAAMGDDPLIHEATPGQNGQPGIFPANRVPAYYGFPGEPTMGILGEYEPERLLELLREQAAAYEAVDPSRPVKLAFETMASVAQGSPGDKETYLLQTSPTIIQRYVDFTAANDLLLILDCQFGRDTLGRELRNVRPWLKYPHVHLALDPEFKVKPPQLPGIDIGSITGERVTHVQKLVSRWAAEDGVPQKFLIVHQFVESMITEKETIAPVPGVQLVIDADGWGTPDAKRLCYHVVIEQMPIEYHGFKLFYRQDDPLMTPEEVLAMTPPVDFIMYQ